MGNDNYLYERRRKQLRKKHKKPSLLKKIGTIVAVLVLVLAVIGGAAYFGIQYFVLGKTNYVQTEQYTVVDKIQPEIYVNEEGEIETETEAVLEEKVEQELVAKQQEALNVIKEKKEEQQQGEKKEKGIYNLLLIGVDRWDNSWNGNSDVMLLATVNDYTEKVYLTSFMRDLYANIPEVGVRKLNAACAYGGPQLCVETIKSNYGVTIDDWAMVDFDSMADIIDEVGGVDLELSMAEADFINGRSASIYELKEKAWQAVPYTEGGMTHLDGCQAVTHARNRSVGADSDFGRTQRQRDVLNAMIKQLVSQDIKTITSTIWTVLPNVTHSLSNMEILSLMTKLPAWIKYDVEQLRLPYDGEWYSENEILIPTDMGATLDRLLSTIYAK